MPLTSSELPLGKCREFRRKRVTFPYGWMGYLLHRLLSPHLPFPPSGKVPGFSAKTVHFSPWLAGVPTPQAPLATPAISAFGESAGLSCENGSLSPRGSQGTCSAGLSGGTRHSLPRGKCREFLRKRFTFPRGMRLLGRSSRTCFWKCLVYRYFEKEHLLDLG